MRRLRTIGVAAAAAAMSLAANGGAQAAAPAPWVGPVEVSQATDGAGSCSLSNCPGIGPGDVAVTPDGDVVAAWTRQDASGAYHVEAAERPAGGSFGTPQDVGIAALEPDPFNGFVTRPSPPEVEVDAQGAAVIAWLGPVTGKRVVQAVSKPGGGSFGEPANVSSPGQDASNVRLAMNRSGEAVTVWSRSNGTDAIAQAAVRAPGGAFGAPQDLSETGRNATEADVAIDSQGNAVAVWARSNGTNVVVQAATRPAGGNFSAPAAAQSLSANGANAISPDVALDAQGRATAIWQRGSAIQSSARNTGGAFGSVDDLGTSNLQFAKPQVAVDGENTAVAVWLSNFQLQSAARPSAGSFGPVQDVSAPATASGISPRLAVNRDGDAQAVWIKFMNTTAGPVQTARRPAGGQFGAVETLTDATEFASAARVAIDDLGNAAVIFPVLPGNSTSGMTARVAGFDHSAPKLRALNVPGTAAAGEDVAFSAQAFDVWSPVSTTWDFGDGGTTSGVAASHRYVGGGTFSVTARVRDQFGHETAETRAVQVAAPPAPSAAGAAAGIDGDRDGFFAGQDCNDANPEIRPGAREIPGNDVDENCDGLVARNSITSLIATNWKVRGARVTLASMVVRAPLPKGTVVEIRCRGKSCPFGAKKAREQARRSTKTLKKGEIDVLRVLSKRERRFRARQALEVRITAPGFNGRFVRVAIKAGKIPVSVAQCLPLGATKPQRSCS